jgi:hypothetical protein
MQILAFVFFSATFLLALWAIGSVIRDYGDRIVDALAWEDGQSFEAETVENVLTFTHAVRRISDVPALNRLAA